MPKVIADITMSLDGYVTGPGAGEQHGLGDAPELQDPTGRFDKRRWDAEVQLWTAQTAMMEAETTHDDPPRMGTAVQP